MTSEEWKQQRFENWCRETRLQSQIKNNALKPKLDTEDVLETADFIFSPIRPFDRVGDSGNLLEEMAGTGDWQEGHRFSSGASDADAADWVASLNLNE